MQIFWYQNKQAALALYRALVKPLLKYGTQFCLEKVQVQALKFVL